MTKLSLRDNFCSSPWFHIKIDPAGNYVPCRWDFSNTLNQHNVANTSLLEFFNSSVMSGLRTEFLQGQTNLICKSCQYEESQGKVNGRQRQLLKSAIYLDNFDKTFCSSPHWSAFEYSHINQGASNRQPVDLQIDLGNTCNSSCIMCYPRYSSRLAGEYIKLHKISPLFDQPNPRPNWTDDPKLVDKFVAELADLDQIKYLHFLGGETLYLKSFYDICDRLIDSGLSKNIILGTTTNCTIYDQRIEKIIDNFKETHLGLSIESVTALNDYVRYPSNIDSVLTTVHRFLDLRKTHPLQVSLRITPSVLSIWHIDQLFEFMLTNSVIAESCNILQEPACLRTELLPQDLRDRVIEKIQQVIDRWDLQRPNETILNRRRVDLIESVTEQTVFEYLDFVQGCQEPQDLDLQRRNLVEFLKAFETLHKNSILDHLPEYEEFLRSHGY